MNSQTNPQTASGPRRILVTGATGYVGGRLIPHLLKSGHEVCLLVRDPQRLQDREWLNQVTVFQGDLLNPNLSTEAFADLDAAYYMVHSMLEGADFEQRDRAAAERFAARAKEIPHVIYLGGLQPDDPQASAHLSSRAEVGRILAARGNVTEFRAGPVIGSGSASFEMVRYLTERLPVMIAPRWINNRVQPIGIADLLIYLTSALKLQPAGVVEIGAPSLTFRDMMTDYAQVRGLHPLIFPVPVLTPYLSSLWVGLVTPIPNRLATPLIKGIIRPVLADTSRAEELFPEISPLSYKEAVTRALRRLETGAETRWSDALGDHDSVHLSDREGVIREVRQVRVNGSCSGVFQTVSSLGGNRGWLVWNQAWKLRGLLDRLLGGPGLRRGRRHPTALHAGEAVDFWRVEEIHPPHRLRLRAEMKIPGQAWLDFEADPQSDGSTLLRQTAHFAPRGPFGYLYWWTLYPLHRIIFSDLIQAIARNSGQASTDR